MKLYKPLILLSFSLSFSFNVWCIPLENEELSIESSDSSAVSYKSLPNKKRPLISPKNESLTDVLLKVSIQETSLNAEKGGVDSSKDEQIIAGETDFYLFEQEELDAQKPGLELYQTLAPMLSPELKKDAKKVWAETADFRAAIDFSTQDSDSKKLVLQQSTKEMALLKGKTLEEISNKNLPPALYDEKEPDKAMVRELFDSFYELLKNALLIIAGILISGKIISFIVNKVIAGRDRRKKRQARRHSKRRRKKRRRTFA